MKRPHEVEELPDNEENARRTRTRLEDSNLEAGNLDLNAAPMGFDLNAPITEELESVSQPSWIPDVSKDGHSAKQIVPKDVKPCSDLCGGESGGLESDEFFKDGTKRAAGSEEKDVRAVQQSKETDACDALGNYVGETPNSLEQCKSSVNEAILYGSLESVAALGINEDLDILSSIWNAYEHADAEAVDAILTEACEELAKNPFSPSKYHYLTCVYISKKMPQVFSLQKTFKTLMTFLGAINSQNAAKRQTLLPVLASKLLSRAFDSALQWPLDFVRAFLEDAISFRSWIDLDGCKEFVANILTAFCDGEAIAMLDDLSQPRPQGSPGEPEGQKPRTDAYAMQHPEISALKSRYSSPEMRRAVRKEFLQAVHHLLSSPSAKENPRQLIKLLMQGAGYEEVRVIGSSMLESWLNNPVHLRNAKALLDRIVEQLCGLTDNDITTVKNLLALRVPSVQTAGQMKSLHGNIYTDMITQLLQQRPEYSSLALKTFVIAEINGKNLSNLKNIGILLKVMPALPPPEQELALVLQEQALHEENRTQLREFIRRLMKHLGQELNVQVVCRGLLQPWPAMAEQDESLKNGWLTQLVDLACQLLVHAIAPIACDESFMQVYKTLPKSTVAISEAFASFSEEKSLLLEKFSRDMATFQTEAMEWCTDVLVNYLPNVISGQFKSIVEKFLFLEDPQVFFASGENISDVESNSFEVLGFCTRASEEVLARLILMGISTGFPLTQAEALEIIGKLVWRAAGLDRQMRGAIEAESTQLPVAILKLASFHLPGVGRQAPLLVFKDLYWRACLIVLLITVNNTAKLGKYVWENIPTVRCMLEALLTCSQDFLLISCETERKEAERQELEALEWDAKAEETVAVFMLEKRHGEEGATGMCFEDTAGSSTVCPQNNQWRGNVMFLDHTKHSRRPSANIIKDVGRAEELYQLGQRLRKCKDPDFFVEVTTSQALSHAWLWLRKVLTQEPELVTRLALMWQVELLYLYEELCMVNHKYSIDLSCLYESLYMAITQEPTSKEIEIDAIMKFLSMKLASNQSIVRLKARCCFSGIFNCFFSKETLPSKSEKGWSLLGFASVRKENLGWLEGFDVIPTSSRLLNTICSAICKAVQHETSVEVVLAFLAFLKEHSSPTSVACTVAFLAIKRKLLVTTLLRTAPKSCVATRDPSISFPQSCQSITGFFLETFREALEVGLISSEPNFELTSMFLVSPYYQGDSKDIATSRVSTKRIIVDAAIQVITLLSSEENEPLLENVSYERIIGILFPGFVNPIELGCKEPFCMAWLEMNSGDRLPLLCEDQAQALSRSKDRRLVQAGLFALDKEAKMEICACLGLSSVGIEALVKELGGSDVRWMAEAKHGNIVLEAKNMQRMQESFSLIEATNARMGEHLEDPLCNVHQPHTSKPSREHPSAAMDFETEMPAVQKSWREIWYSRKLSIEEIVLHLIQLSQDRNSLTTYMQTRKILQEVSFSSAAKTVLRESGLDLDNLVSLNEKSLSESLILRLNLPILNILASFRTVLVHVLEDKIPQSNPPSKFKHTLGIVFEHLANLQKGAIGQGSDIMNEGNLQTLSLADHLVKDLHRLLLEPLQRTDFFDGNFKVAITESRNNKTSCQTKVLSSSINGFTYQNIEHDIYKYLQSNLNPVWKEKGFSEENRLKGLTKELCMLIENWNSSSFMSGTSENCLIKKSGFTAKIARAGLYGMLLGPLKHLDIDVVLQHHLAKFIEVSCSFLRENDTWQPMRHFYPSVIFEWIVHQSSWIYNTKAFRCFMKALESMINHLKRTPLHMESGGKDAAVNWEIWERLLSLGALMEFVMIILQSPHTQLYRHMHHLQSFSDSNVYFKASLATPDMIKVICLLGIIVSAICSIVSRSCLKYEQFELPSEENLQIEQTLMKHFCLKYEKVVMKVLTLMASQDMYAMKEVVHELWYSEQGVDNKIFNNLYSRNVAWAAVAQSSAKKLLLGLYMAYPVSVEAVLQPMRCREMTTSNFSMSLHI